MNNMIKIIASSVNCATHHIENYYPRSLKTKPPYKKVRLKKYRSVNKCNIIFKFYLNLLIYLSFFIICVLGNRPPKFLLEGQSEIVIRLKEGSESPIGMYLFIYYYNIC